LPVKAGADGIVKKVHYKVDETVEAGSLLVSMKEEEEEK
jgi:biotin carboxyl carrier protein